MQFRRMDRRRILFLGMSLPLPFVLPALSSCGGSGNGRATPTATSAGATSTSTTSAATSAATAVVTPTLASQLSCVATPQETEGPYFVEEALTRSDVRTDPSNGKQSAGVPLALALRVFRVDGAACAVLPGAHVDIWQCDANGVYGDVAANNTVGQKFLRGNQVADARGAVNFTTIYPGWYPGRAVHIHFKVRTYDGMKTAYEFTSQFYFDDALTDDVFAKNAPYNTRKPRDTRNTADGIFSGAATDGTVSSNAGKATLLTLTPDGNGYRASFDIGIDMTKTVSDPMGGGGAPGR